MRKSARSSRAKGGFSVLERRAAQQEAQAKREEAEAARAAEKAVSSAVDEDIEVVLTDNEEVEQELEQVHSLQRLQSKQGTSEGACLLSFVPAAVQEPTAQAPPRKSPKKQKKDTAGQRSQRGEATEQRQSPRKISKKATGKGAAPALPSLAYSALQSCKTKS